VLHLYVQARAEVDAAKQQLVLLQAEADGARIRGNAEAQAAQVSCLESTGHISCTCKTRHQCLNQERVDLYAEHCLSMTAALMSAACRLPATV
jgi:hypothetical protein